jgi:hypothetical protein
MSTQLLCLLIRLPRMMVKSKELFEEERILCVY